MCGSDEAEIGLHGLRSSDPLEPVLLQHSQQFGLQRGAELGDLVEKQRTAVGELEAPGLALVRPGEGPLLVPKELGLLQRLCDRRAVDVDERTAAPRAVVVDRPGDELLPRAALAVDQHGNVARSDLVELTE